ncbi:MAG: hypothetical protein ABSH34_15615, partial [Verrucomicrobiota bacterium]
MPSCTQVLPIALGVAIGLGSSFPAGTADATPAGLPDSSTANPSPAPLALTAQQDHQKMMDLLHITSLRKGADPNNTNAPNAVNYDESKANPYPNLPDPMVLKNGQKVTTAEIWWKQRRPEIVEEFDREIYGRVPKEVPAVRWEVTSTTRETNGEVPVITKQLAGHVDNSSCPLISVDIQLALTTPARAAGPVPVMLEFGFSFGGRSGGFGATNRAGGTGALGSRGFGGFGGGGPAWQQQAVAKGWGYALLTPNSIQADTGA